MKTSHRVPWFRRPWRRRPKPWSQTEVLRLREGDFLIVSSNKLVMAPAEFRAIKRHFDEAFARGNARVEVIVVPVGFKFHVARVEVPHIHFDGEPLSDSQAETLRKRIDDALERRR